MRVLFILLGLFCGVVCGRKSAVENSEQYEEAATLVESGKFKQAESLLNEVAPPKKNERSAVYQNLYARILASTSREAEALVAHRKAVKIAPKKGVYTLHLGQFLVRGDWDSMSKPKEANGKEAQALAEKILKRNSVDADGLLLLAKAYRSTSQAKAAEDTLSKLMNSTLTPGHLVAANLESGNLYLEHKMYPSAMKMYQAAHDNAEKESRAKDLGKQGGALCMAKHSKCDRGAKDAQCSRALDIFREVNEEHLTGSTYWMVGMILKNMNDDVENAVQAMAAAVALDSTRVDWWEKLARWSQIAHHRIPAGGFENIAVKQARKAMSMAHQLNPFNAPEWVKKVEAITRAAEVDGTTAKDRVCKDPISEQGQGSGFLEEGEQSAFHLPNRDPDYNCDTITVDEAPVKFYRDYVLKHRPVIIKDAMRDWPASPAEWTEERMSELAGDEVVDVAFTAEDGHLNRFEPLDQWNETFKDAHWRVNDMVLVRPKYEHLYFRDYLALLHRGGAAKERNSYLHQTEMHMFFPQLLDLIEDPPWMPENVWVKEINLWMSAGGTVTSLHVDTSENIMHMVAGQKEFLLLRPNQKKHLHYETVPEIRFDDSGNGPGARINDIHGLVDPANVNWTRFPNYRHAHGLRCHVKQGDALYVPSFWHHAVYSPPGTPADGCRNIGINYWYIATKNKEDAFSAHGELGADDREL